MDATVLQIGLWTIVVIAEGIALWLGQRRLFWMILEKTGSRALAYVLVAPGTVMHEASHWLACKLCGARVGRVELFRPRRTDQGVTLGFVEHETPDPLRATLIAIAPVLLVPPLLAGIMALLLGTGVFNNPLAAFWQAPHLLKLPVLYLLLSAGSAAFPSPGDRIPLLGAILLGLLLTALAALLDPETWIGALRMGALLGAGPAAAAALQLVLFRKRSSRIGSIG